MPAELGNCPTCKREVSTSASSCPHCGETVFGKKVFDKDTPIVECGHCKNGRYIDGDGDSLGCSVCAGSGAVYKCKIIDLRTGKEGPVELLTGPDYSTMNLRRAEIPAPRPTSWPPISPPTSSGCLVIIGAFLTLASALLIAVLF